MPGQPRGLAVITGANGGMGRACARRLGATLDLVLTDASPALGDFARELEREGFTVRAAIAGDFCSDGVMQALGEQARGGFTALVHACGLPPSADWRAILTVNYLASVRLLDALTPGVRPGSAAVLVASVAGHLAPSLPAVDALLADPFAPGMLDALLPVMQRELGQAPERSLGKLSYALSKRKVIDLCEARAADWGARGGRIVSLSPGMIFTPMGRHEAELDPAAEAQVTSSPVGRWGTAAEIAAAACFLLGPEAGFITGTDLRIDGGAVGALHAANLPPWFESLRG